MIPRTANLGKSRDLVLVVTFAVLDSRLQLQDTVLAVSDLRQRVIATDQSDRSPVWPYQSQFDLRAVVAIVILYMSLCGRSPICQGYQNTVSACLIANELSRQG